MPSSSKDIIKLSDRTTTAAILAGIAAAGIAAVAAYRYYYKEERDRVTISLYSSERIGNNPPYDQRILNEIATIKKIQKKLSGAASEIKRTPPEIIVSVLLIPDWEEGSSYTNKDYNKARELLLSELKNQLQNGIYVEDFYAKKSLSQQEKGYLHQLQAKGSIADMIKTHAIICPENQYRRHLQMDSNTKIPDFIALYRDTFGAQTQSDALNASYYDEHYVSAHNKIVYSPGNPSYTTPGSNLVLNLRKIHLDYCATHQDDHLDEKLATEKTKKNSIYARDFTIALETIDLVKRRKLLSDRTIFSANLEKKIAYRLTAHVLTAVNMSWSDNSDAQLKNIESLKKLTPIEIGDAECDYACFANAVKKYTGNLSDHTDDLYDDEKPHKALMAISNQDREQKMIREYLDHVFDEHHDMYEAVARTIPNNPRGNALIKKLYNNEYKTVQELYERKNKVSISNLSAPVSASTPVSNMLAPPRVGHI